MFADAGVDPDVDEAAGDADEDGDEEVEGVEVRGDGEQHRDRGEEVEGDAQGHPVASEQRGGEPADDENGDREQQGFDDD